jgi:hypothetical protein
MVIEDEIRAVLAEHDRCWTELDLEGLAALWDTDDPHALYLGDEYRDPVVGDGPLRRHWGRLGTRLRAATLRTEPAVLNVLSDRLVLVMMDVSWGFAGVEGGEMRHGCSWVSAVLRRTEDGWRIVSYMERLSSLDQAEASGQAL